MRGKNNTFTNDVLQASAFIYQLTLISIQKLISLQRKLIKSCKLREDKGFKLDWKWNDHCNQGEKSNVLTVNFPKTWAISCEFSWKIFSGLSWDGNTSRFHGQAKRYVQSTTCISKPNWQYAQKKQKEMIRMAVKTRCLRLKQFWII